jgi:hypothetical protein
MLTPCSDPKPEEKDSLDFFFEKMVAITYFEEDQVDISRFFNLYDEFCTINCYPKVDISPSLVAQRFNIDTKSIHIQFI